MGGPSFCEACGSALNADARFCGKCGHEAARDEALTVPSAGVAPEPSAPPLPPPPPPPLAPAPPPAAAPWTQPAGEVSGGGLAISPVAMVVCIIGAVLVIVSIFLNWFDTSVGFRSVTYDGRETPLDFLWDKSSASDDPSLVIALVPAALLIAVGALKQLRWLALIGGIVAVVVAVVFVYQVNRIANDLPSAADIGLFDLIGIAPWFALLGGVFGVVGALVPRPSSGA